MKSLGRFILPALAWLVALLAVSAKPIVTEISTPKSGTISADRVNVRARASLIGERVTQLRKEDTVTVLATVKIDPPKEGEPSEWLKIAMPAGGQTWVHMAFVKEGKVTATKLNVRAGGSERFSIVGRLAKDDEVKEKRTSGDWIEIEHPKGAFAYVSAKFVEIGEAATQVEEEKTETTETTEVTETTEATEKTEQTAETTEDKTEATTEVTESTESTEESTTETETTETTEESTTETETKETTETTEATESTESKEEPTTSDMPDVPEPDVVVVEEGGDTNSSKQPTGNPEDAEEIKPEAPAVTTKKELPVPPPRVVTREGKIKRRFFRSPRAPSRYELVDEKGRTLNYLFSSDARPLTVADDDEEPITFERLMNMLRNRKVVLTGVEAVDPRWPSLPLLDVRTLKTVP
jgi:hypothetical protein